MKQKKKKRQAEIDTIVLYISICLQLKYYLIVQFLLLDFVFQVFDEA